MVALYHGLQLQLMVYMEAAVQNESRRHPEREIIPAGVFYYRIQDPLVEQQEEQLEKAILKALKPDGIINLSEDSLAHLEHRKEGESLAVPVRYNKNGSLAKSSRVASDEEFRAMMSYAVQKVEESRRKILSGDTMPSPYLRGQETGCDYCPYRHVCGFDRKIPGYEYRDIGKTSKEEAMAAMIRARQGQQEKGDGQA